MARPEVSTHQLPASDSASAARLASQGSVQSRRLSYQVAEQIRRRISSGEYRHGSRLPSEVSLSASFGVSRATLREALRILEDEGATMSRRGAGSFVRPESSLIVEGLEKLGSWTKSIRKAGFLAEDRVLSVKAIELVGSAAQSLDLENGSSGYMIESIRLANKQPVIYSCSVLKGSIFADADTLMKRNQYDSLLDFLRDTTGIKIAYCVENLRVMVAAPPITHLLSVESGSPLLLMEGVAYCDGDRPVYVESSFFRCDIYDFILVRRP